MGFVLVTVVSWVLIRVGHRVHWVYFEVFWLLSSGLDATEPFNKHACREGEAPTLAAWSLWCLENTFLKSVFCFICISVLLAYNICAPHVCLMPMEFRRGTASPATGDRDGYESPWRYWKPNPRSFARLTSASNSSPGKYFLIATSL